MKINEVVIFNSCFEIYHYLLQQSRHLDDENISNQELKDLLDTLNDINNAMFILHCVLQSPKIKELETQLKSKIKNINRY